MDVEHTAIQLETAFSVQSESYSGPLDLLIDLIEKRKFLINDISIAAVADDYMEYIAKSEETELNDTASFIVLASTLILLKSKSLLPVLDFTESEEESIDSLEKRLRYYQIFRNVGKDIESNFGNNISHERRFVPEDKPLFITDACTELDSLHHAMSNVLTNLPKKVKKPKVQVRTVVSLETMIDRLRERIENQFIFNFQDFTKDEKERSTVIVGFLAVLEMVKQGGLVVRQTNCFRDIHIERAHATAPRYQ